MKLNVYGRRVEVAKIAGQWKVFYLGNEGKKRLAEDIVLPPHIVEEDIVQHIADLCHEWATPESADVQILVC